MLGEFVKSCSPWAGLVLRSLWRTISRERDLQAGAGEECEESSPEEEGVAETTCDELTVTPIPHPPVPLREERWRNMIEVEPRKKGGLGGKVF